MNRATQLALNAINQRFYAAIAAEWIETRKYAWPGFERIVARLPAAATREAPLRVLDLGCGDGRFAQYLAEHTEHLRYLGCDASSALLAHANTRGLGPRFEFCHTDFVSTPASTAIPGGEFDLVCVLGVLHHVPGRTARQLLLRELGARLSAHGLLAVTIWRLTDDPRFATRVVPFADYNRAAAEPIALDQLEPGDTLLRWGSAGAPARYCHFPDRHESEQVLGASGLRIVERFHADGRGGRLNEYALLAH